MRHPLDPVVLAEVEGLAQRCRVPRVAVLLAGFEVLLARWSGLRDLTVLTLPDDGAETSSDRAGECVGTVELIGDYRPDEPFDELIGDYRPDEPFDELVARVAAQLTKGLTRRGMPLGDEVERLGRARDSRRPPFEGVSFRVNGRPPVAECAMAVDVSSMELVFRHAEELLDAATVRLLAHYYVALLAAATADPSTAVGAVRFASPAAALRSPGAVAELMGALPDAEGGIATGARIVDDADGGVMPVGLFGRLQLEIRDTADGLRWVDTAAFGRFTTTGEIMLDRAAEPECPVATPATSRRLRADSAAGMAAQLAALWASKLGLSAVEPGKSRLELGGGLSP
ncbi:hypothetical protein ACFWP7_03440 [Streptomyces sp. NPDC058470]|uniref:hypothetical protein n=1 Tax=Streptomyces sp. NPDC058470 TaxID=3346515 RepID=UPI00365D7F68